MAYRYDNREYMDMIVCYFTSGQNFSAARNRYKELYGKKRRVPTLRTFHGAYQRLYEYGQFRPPNYDAGALRRSDNIEERVLDYFHDNPHASTRDAAQHLGISHTTVWRLLREEDRHLSQANVHESTKAKNKKTATPTTTKKTTAKAPKKIKKKKIGKIRKGKAVHLQDSSTSDAETSSEDTDRGIETVTFHEIVEQEAAEHGDALRAGAAASGLCCCCLREPSGVLLCSSAERYADMLQECFGITMDASLRAGATICRACAAKVTEALAFKRQVLRCQTAILALQATESVVVKEEPADETPSKEDASMDILATETARQNNFLSQMKDTYGEYVMYLQQNEQLFGPVGAMGAPAADRPPRAAAAGAEAGADDESFLRGGCRCPLDCVSKFSASDVRAVRRLCRQLNVLCPLNANHLDVFLLGALACLYRTRRGAPPGARSEDAVRHAVLGTDVCRNFFLYSYGAPQRQYDGALARVVALLACLAGEEDPLNVAQMDVDIKEEVAE